MTTSSTSPTAEATGSDSDEYEYEEIEIEEEIEVEEEVSEEEEEASEDDIEKPSAEIRTGYAGHQPLCNGCKMHHTGPCTVRCRICQQVGHLPNDCRSKPPLATGSNLQALKLLGACFGCGEMGHYKSKCPKNPKKKGQQFEGCFGCGEMGHCESKCPKKKKKGQQVMGKETIIYDEEKAPQYDGGMISGEVTNLKNKSSKEVTGGSLNAMDKVPHIEDQNGDAVTSPIESITPPHLQEQTSDMIIDDVNDAQQKEPRSSPAVEVNKGNKRPANEVNEENKRQAVICDFFVKSWCIKGNSCKFRHIKDHTSEPQNDEGLATSEVKPELQKEKISVNDAGTNADSSLHEASSNLINGSDTLKGNQFGFHNNKMPTTSYSINHNSSSFQSTKIMPPSNHSSVWPMNSCVLSSPTLKHLGSQSEHLYSTNEVLLNPVTKLSTYEWAPSKPFRSAFLISQGIYTPDIQYDPFRDSIESPKIEPSSSRLPSISATHSPKNVNPLKIETIGSDRGSLASHVNDNEIDMDVASEKGNTKSDGKGKLYEGLTKQVKVKDESSQYHKIELDPEGDMRKEPKALRLFRAALIEFIKELLKPTWREGKLSKGAHNLIVKKAVDKVVSIQAESIPSMQEAIDNYLSQSKPKLQKLVEGYIEKHGKL